MLSDMDKILIKIKIYIFKKLLFINKKLLFINKII